MLDSHPRRFWFASLLTIVSTAYADDSALVLDLPAAQMLAITQQPMLEAQVAAIKAARDAAVAAAQLPDPKLTGGVSSWPIDGPDRYSLRRDDFTMINVGIEQEFPLASKRRLQGERGEHEAELAEQMLYGSRLAVERDAALAWIDVWRQERALELTRASLREAELQAKATEIAYTTSRATQTDVLSARITAGLLHDELAALEDESQLARSKLSRWIGAAAAQRPLSDDLPAWAPPPALPDAVARLRTHPHLNTEAKRLAIAEDEVALARQAYKPDWRAGLAYGYRPDFSDYVSVNVAIDLPVFTSNRQDRNLGAKLAEQTQAEQSREDMFRQEEADLRLNWLGWQRLQTRIEQFDREILPQSQQRINAALASWQVGQGTLAAVIDARRMALDNGMKRLELMTAAARYRVALQYFAGDSP
ncbi:Outer membrane protein TolC [Solimonas aquatica]|jgi:outer membrane protein TolC|uniref:Outer membrane protein TolC n=1 Tax=Solimonas aquatica TaxID=489703 RepID=A0A1H9DW43_9GAMM|nr:MULTISPECIES: TolC family protein [Solimonas]SEQ17655.1 Outer membrane protein TolC [Solimonas aquatica]